MPKIIDLPPLIEDITEDDLLIIRNDSDSETQKGTFAQLLSWLQSIWLPKNKYCFSAYLGSDQNLGDASVVQLNINTENYDTNGDFDTATYKYVAPVAGVYHFDGRVNHTNASVTPVVAYTMIYKGSTEVLRGNQSIAGTAAAFGWTVSGDVLLAEGDEVTLRHYQDSAGTEVADAVYSYFSGHLVHAV